MRKKTLFLKLPLKKKGKMERKNRNSEIKFKKKNTPNLLVLINYYGNLTIDSAFFKASNSPWKYNLDK